MWLNFLPVFLIMHKFEKHCCTLCLCFSDAFNLVKTIHKIFLKFYMKLEGLKLIKIWRWSKSDKVIFMRKLFFWEKTLKLLPNQGSLGFCLTIKSIDVSCFTLKMRYDNVLYDSAKTAYLGKFSFSAVGQNAFCQSYCRILWSSLFNEGISQYLMFFAWGK